MSSMNVGRLANIIRGRCMRMMHELTGIYRPAISRPREKLMEVMKEQAEAATKSELAKKLRVLKGYYTVELSVKKLIRGNESESLMSDLKSIQGFMKNNSFTKMTVKEAWLLFLVGLEVVLWFFLGETIGKGHIVGYKV